VPKQTANTLIAVKGLNEMQAALRAADKQFPRRLRVANLEAAKIVASTCSVTLALGTSKMAAKAAPSIRASAQQRSAGVTFGGARYPFAFGANWGAHHDLPRNASGRQMVGWNQFPEFTKKDRFIYRAIDQTAETALVAYEQAIDRMLADLVGVVNAAAAT
jgi:hypothetical protein